MRLVARVRPKLLAPRVSIRGAVPFLVGHAVAFTLVAHCHYWMKPPSRLVWAAAELVLGTLLGLLARRPVRHLADRVRAARAVGLTVGVGLALAAWWHGELHDTLWVQAPALQPLLAVLLFLAHAGVAGFAFAAVLAAVAATDGEPAPSPNAPPATRPWLTAGLFAAAAVAFAGWFVRQERVIYFADAMYYWNETAGWAEQLVRSPAAAWEAFRLRAQHGGYTLVPCAGPALAMAVLGDARIVFVAATAALYLTATFAAATWFVRRTTGVGGLAPAVVTAAILLPLPLAWVPVLMGYLDVGGVALAVGSLWLAVGRPREAQRWPHLFATAAVLVLMILFRRWYSFWAVGLLTVTLADGFLAAAVALRREAWRAVRPAVVTCGLFPLVMAAVALPMMPGMAGANYTNMLTGYRVPETTLTRIGLTAGQIGGGSVALAGLAAVFLLGLRDTRRPTLFLLGTTAVMVPMFYRMQDPNPHHQYLVLPLVLLLPAMALVRLVRGWPRRVVAAAIFGWGAFNLLGTVSPTWRPVRDRLAPVTATAYYPPAARTDGPEFERLLTFVTDETTRTGKGFVVLSSSPTLHSSMLQSVGRTWQVPFPAAAAQLLTFDVDQVYGFPYSVFQADLVLVADPLQLHMRPEEQQAIAIPCRLLQTREGVGRAFEKLPDEFALQDGVRVAAYRRTRTISPDEWAAFCEELRRAHPDNPHFYEPRLPAEELMKMPATK